MDVVEDLSTLKRLLVELELKVASLEERLGQLDNTMQDILSRINRLEREHREEN